MRAANTPNPKAPPIGFPFLFGGTFIEGRVPEHVQPVEGDNFPSFSEGLSLREVSLAKDETRALDFPSFSEGLSLRAAPTSPRSSAFNGISLPFRRDFH